MPVTWSDEEKRNQLNIADTKLIDNQSRIRTKKLTSKRKYFIFTRSYTLTSSRQFHDILDVDRPDVVVVAFDPGVSLLLYPGHVMARIGGSSLVGEDGLELIIARVVGSDVLFEEVREGVVVICFRGFSVFLESGLLTNTF